MIRILIAGGIAMLISLVGTKGLVTALTRARVGQPIHEDAPEGHVTKAGTPTMGGIAIVAGAFLGYVASQFIASFYEQQGEPVFTETGIIVILTIVAAGAVGFVDDWLKVSNERNLGLNKTAKIVGLLSVAFGFAITIALLTDIHTEISFTRVGTPGIEVGTGGWVLWAVLLVLASSNAVNLTDGLDGLAAGTGGTAFLAFTVIGFWAFRNPEIYDTPHALDLAVIGAAMLGGAIGFLWWNAAPAQIFMGDTGSLALGTGLAALALTLNTHLLLPIVGAIFVAEAISVILQVASFRLTGRRVFRMAPIHHHFELRDWPETTVIIRFWILAVLTAGVGLGIFYADFVSLGAATS